MKSTGQEASPEDLVHELLEALGAPGVPETLRAVGLGSFLLSQDRQKAAILYALLRRELAEIQALFEEKGIPLVLLKGEPLETLLYQGRYRRGTGDLDLLVLPGDREAAGECLGMLGYEALDAEGPRMWSHNQEAFRHPDRGFLVEVHWAVAEPRVGQLPVGVIIEEAQPFEFENGLIVQVQRPDHLLLHLALHYHHHMGFARGLLDLAAWENAFGQGEEKWGLNARALARERGIEGLLDWPAWTIRVLTGKAVSFGAEKPAPWALGLGELSAWAMRGYLDSKEHWALRATLVEVMPRMEVCPTVLLQTLTMGAVDSGGRLEALLWPILRGPHWIGRWTAKNVFL